jgi:glucose dehydrogenase
MTDTDILIVGAGVAGAMIGHRLASQVRKVTILEAGPRIDRWDTVELFRQSINHNNFMAPFPGTPHAPNGSPFTDYVIQKGEDDYAVQFIRGVGGTTWHWAAAT